jgi:hypothetical protein
MSVDLTLYSRVLDGEESGSRWLGLWSHVMRGKKIDLDFSIKVGLDFKCCLII